MMLLGTDSSSSSRNCFKFICVILVAGFQRNAYVDALPTMVSTALGAFAFPLAMAPGQATDAFKQAKNFNYQQAAQHKQVLDQGIATGQQNIGRMAYGRSLLEASAYSPLSAMLQAEAAGHAPEDVWQTTANAYQQGNQMLDGTRSMLEQLYPQPEGQQQQGVSGMPPGIGAGISQAEMTTSSGMPSGMPSSGMPLSSMPSPVMESSGMPSSSMPSSGMLSSGMPSSGMPSSGMPSSGIQTLAGSAPPFGKPVSIL